MTNELMRIYLENTAKECDKHYMVRTHMGQRFMNAKINGLVFTGNSAECLRSLANHMAFENGVDLLTELAKSGHAPRRILSDLKTRTGTGEMIWLQKVEPTVTNWASFLKEALGLLLTHQDAYDVLMVTPRYAVFAHRWEYGNAVQALQEVVDHFLDKGNKPDAMFVALLHTMVRFHTYAVEYADNIVPVLRNIYLRCSRSARPDIAKALLLPCSRDYMNRDAFAEYAPKCAVIGYLIDEFWEDMDTEYFLKMTNMDNLNGFFWRDMAEPEETNIPTRFRMKCWSYIKFCSKAMFLREDGARILLELSADPRDTAAEAGPSEAVPVNEAPKEEVGTLLTILDDDPDYCSDDDPDYVPSESSESSSDFTEENTDEEDEDGGVQK